MLPEETTTEHSQTGEYRNIREMGKTVKTCLIFHNNFVNIFKRQKISDEQEGNKLYREFSLIFVKLSHNSVKPIKGLIRISLNFCITCACSLRNFISCSFSTICNLLPKKSGCSADESILKECERGEGMLSTHISLYLVLG